MAKVEFLADECIYQITVEFLRKEGWKVKTIAPSFFASRNRCFKNNSKDNAGCTRYPEENVTGGEGIRRGLVHSRPQQMAETEKIVKNPFDVPHPEKGHRGSKIEPYPGGPINIFGIFQSLSSINRYKAVSQLPPAYRDTKNYPK